MADFVAPAKNSASPFADMRGAHVGVRAPSLAEAKDFYVGKLDFRVVADLASESSVHFSNAYYATISFASTETATL